MEYMETVYYLSEMQLMTDRLIKNDMSICLSVGRNALIFDYLFSLTL